VSFVDRDKGWDIGHPYVRLLKSEDDPCSGYDVIPFPLDSCDSNAITRRPETSWASGS